MSSVKDKASVLAEVAKLQEIRDELTSEVTSLHAQLEQERSKTRTSTVDVKPSKQTVRFSLELNGECNLLHATLNNKR